MVCRVFLLVALLLGQAALASVPMGCLEPAQDVPCHGEHLEQVGTDISCELRCASCGPVMLVVPDVLIAPPDSYFPVTLQVAGADLPPPEEIFHPPISP